MKVCVIMPAAGLGTRMLAGHGSTVGAAPKQFFELGGVPILVHALRAFAAVPAVAILCVAVRPSEIPRLEALLGQYKLSDRVRVVAGGDTRQASVANALTALEEQGLGDDDVVLVHDAVRPLISPALIGRTIEAVLEHGAAIVGMPATDTIKQVERTARGALITATIPREFIVQAQTPQGFRAAILRRAFAEAAADGFEGTDEASVVERAGIAVAVVPGSVTNMKITQPGDLELAEFFLSRGARHYS